MKNNRILLLITLIAVLSFIVDLPKNYRLSLSFGPYKIDRIINGPGINWNFGFLKVKKDLTARFGLDLSGGTHLVLETDMKNIELEDRERAWVSARDVVERRVNLYGLTEPIVQQAKVGQSYRIIVDIPGVSDANEAIDLIGKTAQLSFSEESSPSAKVATPSSIREMWPISTSLSGEHLKRSDISFDPETGKPQVALEFNQEGEKLFSEITTRNVGRTVAIFLDKELLSAPRVNEAILNGKAVISGNFTLDEAKKLSVALNAGALPVPLNIIQQKNIGATLGNQSIEKSLLAGTIGLLIVALFMIVNYGILGVLADIALVIYAIISLAIFKFIPVTLTLAGVAGFILSIGMAVDANILIFERMKEEIRWGKDFSTSLNLGFNRAFPSIKDANISSLITCCILYYFGTGMVRGFAITLAIGIFVSLFSAITVTRTLLKLIYTID